MVILYVALRRDVGNQVALGDVGYRQRDVGGEAAAGEPEVAEQPRCKDAHPAQAAGFVAPIVFDAGFFGGVAVEDHIQEVAPAIERTGELVAIRKLEESLEVAVVEVIIGNILEGATHGLVEIGAPNRTRQRTTLTQRHLQGGFRRQQADRCGALELLTIAVEIGDVEHR